MKLHIAALSVGALMLLSPVAQANEGVARQIKALKAAMDSFAEVTRQEISDLEDDVQENAELLASFEDCADSGMIYAPGAGADANGCARVSSSQSVNEIDVSSQFVATSRWLHPYNFTESASNGSPGKRGRSYSRIYRIDDPDRHENYVIRGVLSGGGGGDHDSRTSCWGAKPMVKIGGRWHKATGNTINIQNIANGSGTILNGRKVSGKFDRRLAVVKAYHTGCHPVSGQDGIFRAYKPNYLTYEEGIGSRTGYYSGGATTLRVDSILGQ